ncbi:hypothetical protein [Ectobacillus polymachus]|uniref:hypothetical protein n=1 Tax=Ectobacillus polymachus TaxID=1508806 RepID=UPI003A84C92B
MPYFWSNFIASAFGAFVGGLISFFISKWTLNKTILLNEKSFVLKFNRSIHYFEKYIVISRKLLNLGKIDPSKEQEIIADFHELREYLLKISSCFIDLEDNENFEEKLKGEYITIFTEDSPSLYFKKLNALFYKTIALYNHLIDLYKDFIPECIPDKIEMELLIHDDHHEVILQDLEKTFKRVKKVICI